MKKYAWMLIVAVGIGHQNSEAKSSPEEFFHSQVRHVERVCQAMDLAYLRFKDDFKNINSDLIRAWCLIHDYPKFMTLQELKSFGYFPEEEVYTALARYHGVEKEDLPDSEQKYLLAVIKELNRIEFEIKSQLVDKVKKNGILADPMKTIEELKLLERLVDIFDVKKFRTDIANTEGDTRGLAAQFLESRGELTDLGREILTFLEDSFVPHHSGNCEQLFIKH